MNHSGHLPFCRGGGGVMKNQYIGELPKKGGLDSLLIQGGLGKKEGSVFEGGG